MKRVTIGTQLGAIFGAMMILLAGLLGISLYQMHDGMNEYQNMLTGPVPRTMALLRAIDSFDSATADIRGFIAYGDEKYATDTLNDLKDSLEAVKKITATTTSAEARREGEILIAAMAAYTEELKQVIAAKRVNDPGIGNILAAARKNTEIITTQFEKMVNIQNEALQKRISELNEKQNFTAKAITGAGAAIVITAVAAVVWFSRRMVRRMNILRSELLAVSSLDLSTRDVRATTNDEIGDMAEAIVGMKHSLREIVGQVRNSAETLAASSEEMTSAVEEQLRTSGVIAQTAGDIASGSVQNTNNITEISAVIEEVTAGAEEMNANTLEVNNATQLAVRDANQGMQLIRRVVVQNDTIEKSMKDITEVAASLVKGSAEIQEIVTVISSIAGQTNLLALNAAIEAARAGEAGRGFAVVAEEVRKLAEQSASATNHIGEIIRKMTADIDFSVEVVGKANNEVAAGKTAVADTEQGFTAIVEKLGQVQAGMEQISHAVEETAKGMQAVVGNVQNISAVAEETSASTQTVAAASEEQNASLHEVSASSEALARLAGDLSEIIRKFRV